MIRVWRLSKAAHAAFDGEGAKSYGARWHRAGIPVVYTASSLALAALEVFMHIDTEEEANDLVAVMAEIPASVRGTHVRLTQLPDDWRAYPSPQACIDLGTRWMTAGTTAVLAVPSAVVPSELNYLLDPRHPAFRKIRVGRPQPFSFDPRLWKRA
ncbi:MAG: RES domain-containing protein [Candidatus Rokubacteria bacterium]|nr:RES domain-containing protein [Candidatus Rokubacteria bacterium]